jgi:DNA polymerase-4
LIGKQFVKLKFNDFVSTTVEHTNTELDLELFRELCRTGFARGNKPVRLIGLGVRMRPEPGNESFRQLQLRLNRKQAETAAS